MKKIKLLSFCVCSLFFFIDCDSQVLFKSRYTMQYDLNGNHIYRDVLHDIDCDEPELGDIIDGELGPFKKNPNDDKDGMSKKNLIGIKIYGYPNPTHEKVTLYFQSDIDNEGEVAVYNLMGEKVINEFKVKNQEHFAIDLGNNIMGIYIVKFLINGNLYEYKIVKID